MSDAPSHGPTDRPVHLALFLGHHDLLWGHPISYVLAYWCPRPPAPDETVTTALADVTCPHCLEATEKTRMELSAEMGLELRETVPPRTSRLL